MLILKNLRKKFGDLVAVDGLSFEIKKGEVFGLLGPNGAGKTTTVNMAVGILKPESGVVTLQGLGSPLNTAVRRKIGVAPQSLALYDELTGKENLAFYGQIQGLRGKQLEKQIEWALEFVSLTDRATHRVTTYSGGMKRRLNLAAALIHDPPLLLLDEPTAGVDPQSRNAIYENIKQLRTGGKTIVYTTHYMEEAQRLCDRVGIMDHGKLLALDTVSNLINTYGGKNVLIVENAGVETRVETDNPLKTLTRFQQDGPLESFRLRSPDLEGVFLNLTGRNLRN